MDIDYIFKSAFESKVDVGWSYSRVSFIKGYVLLTLAAFVLRLTPK